MSTFVSFEEEKGEPSKRTSELKAAGERDLQFLEESSSSVEKGGNFKPGSPDQQQKQSGLGALGGMNLPVNLNVASPMIREWLGKRREEIRPWGTFVRTSNFDKPSSVAKLSKRLYRNVDHFQSNYVLVFCVLFLYCLITSPMLLIVLAASGGACYILSMKQRERALILGGREISLPQQYALVGICSIPLLLLAGAGSAVFWVIGASFVFIGIHASFYNYDALDINEDTQQLTGSIVEEV